MKEISANQLEDLLEHGCPYILIDVRENYEVKRGMISQAKHIPMNEIPNTLPKLKKDVSYVIICKSGKRSLSVCRYMNAHGYDTINMIDGMDAWKGSLKK